MNLALTNLTRKLKSLFGLLPSGFPDEWQLLPPIKIDEKGLMTGDQVDQRIIHPSWHYAGLKTQDGKPKAIVWHYSDTGPGTAINMATRRRVSWTQYAEDFRKANAGKSPSATSWQVSIETDGTLVQMAPLNVGCFHAGSDTAKPIDGLGWANWYSVGVELIGFGKSFTEEQVISAARFTAAIAPWASIERKNAQLQHSQIDPKRRVDPGPEWMGKYMDPVLEYAYGDKVAT